MKKLKIIIFSSMVGILASAFVVLATNTFPTTLNSYQSGDTIEEEWANALESKIGADGSAVATSLDYLIKAATNPGHTHTNLTVLGTITAGVWNGTAIGDNYLVKTGDWTGIFDGQNGSWYIDRTNHTGSTPLSSLGLATGNIYIGDASNNPIATSSLYVATNGYVGISTTSPAYELDVYGNVRVTGDITGDLLLETIGVTTLDDVQDWLNITQSSGKITNGNTITDGGSGTINIKAGAGFIKTTDSATGTTPYFEWSAINSFGVDTGVVNYIYADYNSGSPTAASTTDRSLIELNRNFTIGRTYYTGTKMKIINSGMNLSNHQRNNHERLIAVKGFERASGGVIAEINERYLTSTAGSFYIGANNLTTDAQNSSTTDEITTWYNDGAWQLATTTQIDNVYYNNYGTGLAELTAQRYGVHWIYICMCGGGELKSIYGLGDYTLAEAELVLPPSSVPDCVDAMAILASKVIIQKNATNFTSVVSLYEVVPGQSSVVNHNDLGSLQGGTSDQYYHLTSSEHTELNGWLDNAILGSNGDISGIPELTVTSTSTLGTIISGTWNGTAIDISDYTNLAVSGTLLDLTDDTLSINEGTLTDTKLCTYEVATGLNCDHTDANTTYTGGTNLTLVDTIFNVNDFAIKNDGDVGTGVYDFGGADSFEIPNGASPTVDANGEIAIDSTNDDHFVYYGDVKNVITPVYERCFTLATTSFAVYEDSYIWHPRRAITVVNQTCRIVAGTSVVCNVSDGTNDMDSITCLTTLVSDSSLTNNTWSAEEGMVVEFGTVTGLVDTLNYCIQYTYDSD